MLKNYLKIAIKVLLRRKFYTFISLFGTAFTLVVLIISASLLDSIFGPSYPELKADRSAGVYLIQMNGEHSVSNSPPGYRFLEQYVRTLPGAEKVTVHSIREIVPAFKKGASIETHLKRTDGQFWEVFDFKFLEGGPFTREDERNRNFVAVINEATRQRFFGGESAVGKFLDVDGQTFRVVGVVANVPYLRITSFSDVWVPISTAKTDGYRKDFMGNFFATVQARDAGSLSRLKQEYESRMARVQPPERGYTYMTGGLDSPFEALSRSLFDRRARASKPGRLLAWLLGFALAFMILPTVNLVNINVSRILERASEIGVRKSFGASSWTLVGQFIIENVLLTLIAGAAGMALAVTALYALNASGFVPYSQFAMNYRVFAYGFGMTLFFGVFSGVYPAWKMSRLHPVEALRGGSL